jgi:hypothetical protein
MTASAKDLLDTFDRLSGEERREAVSEILRRAVPLDYPPLDDETLARIADEAFLEYDAREAADADSARSPMRTPQR